MRWSNGCLLILAFSFLLAHTCDGATCRGPKKNSERLSHIVVALCSWVDGRSKAALIYLPQCFRFKKWKLFEKIASL